MLRRARAAKPVVVHVGAHKTGTTAVQQFLKANRGQLQAERILHLTRSELSEHIGWGERLVTEPHRLGGVLEEFRGQRRQRLFLASHENICGHPFVRRTPGLYPGAGIRIDALRRLLEPFRPRIVLSVRPQHELLESYYLQSINLGGSAPFATWLRAVDLTALSWLPLVDRLVEEFGPDNVEIVDFRRIAGGTAAFVEHFLARALPGVPLEVRWEHRLNASLSERGLAMARAANPLLPVGGPRATLRTFLQRYYSNASGPRPVLLQPDQRQELRARYDGEYERLVSCAALVDRSPTAAVRADPEGVPA